MSKHTPGPWYNSGFDILRGKAGAQVARVGSEAPHTRNGTKEYEDLEMYANAHLIAAAPELLKECESALKILEYLAKCDACNEVELASLKAAIAKAKGEE